MIWKSFQSLLLFARICHSLRFPSQFAEQQLQSSLNRRYFVWWSLAPAGLLLMDSPRPARAAAISTTDTEVLLQQCQNGALSTEQAIPGAYAQACMNIPIREIPVQASTGSTVLLRVEQKVAAAGSTGMAVWNSSLLLKQLLEKLTESEPHWLMRDETTTVLELGCGTGLASMTAALLGAKHVIATDGNPEVVGLAKRNVEVNGLSDTVTTQQLSWGMMDAMDLAGTADVILGADLTYSPGSWRQLAESMETILSERGIIIYLSLGHSGFDVNAEVDGFLSVTQQLGLERIAPTSAIWPFPKTIRALSTVLLESMTPNDRQVVQSTGGVRVEVLQKKMRGRRQQ